MKEEKKYLDLEGLEFYDRMLKLYILEQFRGISVEDCLNELNNMESSLEN